MVGSTRTGKDLEMEEQQKENHVATKARSGIMARKAPQVLGAEHPFVSKVTANGLN